MAKQILIKDSKLKDLKPDPDNPRTISEEKLSSLRKSLEEFGDLSCIVYNELEDKLVGAHQRLKVFSPSSKIVITDKYKKPNRQGTIREGYVLIDGEKFKYRVVRWTKEKHKAAMLAANKHSGEWDQKKLAEIVESLKGSSLDFGLTGFQFADFPKIFPEENKKGLVDDDFVPEPKKTNIKLGDIFELGDHRLMCGDSTFIDSVDTLMNGQKADITFTSPPYNAGKFKVTGTASIGKSMGRDSKYLTVSDDMSESEYTDFLSDIVNVYSEFSDSVMLNLGMLENGKRSVIDLLHTHRHLFKDTVYWRKKSSTPHIQPGILTALVEPIFCFGKHNSRQFKSANFKGNFGNVIEGESATGNEFAKIHTATFPVYLPTIIIEQFTGSGSGVIDCFGGTGTTLIACEKTNRKCFMMELDPHYCQTIIDRWEAYTGRKAVKVSK